MLASPFIKRGLFRFSFRINGTGSGLVVGVADATAVDKFGQPVQWCLVRRKDLCC